MTAPLRMFFSFVRTNAPPLPGFTCWNSTTENKPSGRLRVIPFFRSFVDTAAIWWQPLFRTRVARRSSCGPHTFGERVRISQPAPVTKTVSSVRAPPSPGTYTPGSTVTT